MPRHRVTIYERAHLQDPHVTIRYCGYCHEPIRARDHRYCRVEPGGSERGELEEGDMPVKVSSGFSSRINFQATRWLDRSNDPYDRAMQRLHERYPHWAEAYWRHREDGQPYRDIAQSLGISVVNARVRAHRGRAEFEALYETYGGNLDEIRN